MQKPPEIVYQILGVLGIIIGLYLYFIQGVNLAIAFIIALLITLCAKWLA